jgi:hypothetical protein
VYGPAIAAVIVTAVYPAFISWAKAAWIASAASRGAAVSVLPLIGISLAVGAGVALLALAWKNNFMGIRDITFDVITSVGAKFEAFKMFFEENQVAISNTAMVLGVIFAPALIKTGVEAAIAGVKIASTFVASIINSGRQAVIANANIMMSFVAGMIRTGIVALATGSLITGGLAIALTSYMVQGWQTVASITATTTAWITQKAVMIGSTVATWGMQAAQMALNAAFLANPLTWVIAGVVALIAAGYLLVTNWDIVQAKTLELWGTFMMLVDGAVSIGKNFISGIIDGFTAGFDSLMSTATSIWSKVTSVFSGNGIGLNVTGTSAVDGSHANGLANVPFDGYIAELHQGEAVLTAREAEQYRKLSPEKTQQVMNTSTSSSNTSNDNRVNVGSLFGNVTINNEADIAKIVKMIEEYLRELLNSSGEGIYDV